MGRRFEEKVDVEELARLENPENATDGKIRVKMPNKKVNEMFALASQILGGRRVTVCCAKTVKHEWPVSPERCVVANGFVKAI